MPQNFKKIDIFDAKIGDVIVGISGPGQSPLFPNEKKDIYMVTQKVIDQWGRHLVIENNEGKKETVHSFSEVGIGWYWLDQGKEIRQPSKGREVRRKWSGSQVWAATKRAGIPVGERDTIVQHYQETGELPFKTWPSLRLIEDWPEQPPAYLFSQSGYEDEGTIIAKKCRELGGTYSKSYCKGISQSQCKQIGGKWSSRTRKCRV